jgi:hypothetical protein
VWITGYQEVFFPNFFLFHDGILAITKPFSRTFFFFDDGTPAITKPLTNFFLFSRWNSGYHEAFLTKFFFHDGTPAITKPFLTVGANVGGLPEKFG